MATQVIGQGAHGVGDVVARGLCAGLGLRLGLRHDPVAGGIALATSEPEGGAGCGRSPLSALDLGLLGGRRLLGLTGGLGGVAAAPLLAALAALGLGGLTGLGVLAHAGQRPHAGHRAALTESAHTAGGHGLHHLLGLLEAVHELIDGLDRGPRSLGDTAAARAVEDGQVLALGGRHGAHDRLDAVDLALVEVVQGLTHLPHPGHHAQELLHGAHLADLAQLAQEVVEGEGALGELGGGVLGLLAVQGPLGLLDEGEQVTHVQDA